MTLDPYLNEIIVGLSWRSCGGPLSERRIDLGVFAALIDLVVTTRQRRVIDMSDSTWHLRIVSPLSVEN